MVLSPALSLDDGFKRLSVGFILVLGGIFHTGKHFEMTFYLLLNKTELISDRAEKLETTARTPPMLGVQLTPD